MNAPVCGIACEHSVDGLTSALQSAIRNANHWNDGREKRRCFAKTRYNLRSFASSIAGAYEEEYEDITLITDVLPDDNFTAGQVLRNMLRTLNADHVSVLWINQSRLKRTSDDTLYTVTREYNFAFQGWMGRALHRLTQTLGSASTLSSGIQVILTLWFWYRLPSRF